MVLCSVCINTFRRPQLLTILLESLVNQHVPEYLSFEIIVVDNEPEPKNRSIVEKYSNEKIKVHYLHECTKNISLARNMAVKNAKGDYIFFIDDDEIACSHWIFYLYDTLVKYRVDAVFGRIIPYFDENAPEWVKNAYIFYRAQNKTGTKTTYGRTGNAIVKKEWLNKVEGPFDENFGLTGGEDTNLFSKLNKLGAKYVECFEGFVREYVPPERTEIRWMLNRAKRMGMIFVRRSVSNSNYPSLIILKIFGKSIILFLFSIVCLTIFYPVKKYRLFWLLKISSYYGHFESIFKPISIGY
ncbi:MAG: glycosyltransferase family 2 protein [Calditrichae bacterium]|nr:glycosyltransferase family 2 protein [Calditrichia bacterium]